MSIGYNPDFDPSGIEGGVDTNTLPWLTLASAPGMAIKPLRASGESGMFSILVKLQKGSPLSTFVYLGAMDLMLLSGRMTFIDNNAELGFAGDELEPGVWGYAPANTRIDKIVVSEDVEFLTNCYGPIAFLDDNGDNITHVLTAIDIMAAASAHGIPLIPNTLADCMAPKTANYSGVGAPLAISGDTSGLVSPILEANDKPAKGWSPHFVDTRTLPWLVNPDLPEIALKVLRVSEETGTTSLMVRHNGVAGPHYHLGAADFLVLSGHIGYRAGPAEGYGPGVWFFEPAGARHEATQRIGDDDLIYLANVYGPIQFDEGRGTPIVAVQSWMQYKELADASEVKLVRNTFPHDSTLLAWSSIGGA